MAVPAGAAPEPTITLVIRMSVNGSIAVEGPIEQTLLCYGMLESAKDAIRNYAAEQQRRVQPPSQAEMNAMRIAAGHK